MKLARSIKHKITIQDEGREMTCGEKDLIDNLLEKCFIDLREKSINALFCFREDKAVTLEYRPEEGKRRLIIPRVIYNDVKKYLVENDFIVTDLISNELVINRELKIELPQ